MISRKRLCVDLYASSALKGNEKGVLIQAAIPMILIQTIVQCYHSLSPSHRMLSRRYPAEGFLISWSNC